MTIQQADWNRALLRLANKADHEGSGKSATIDPPSVPDLSPIIQTVCDWTEVSATQTVLMRGNLKYIGSPPATSVGLLYWACTGCYVGGCTDEHAALSGSLALTPIAEGEFELLFPTEIPNLIEVQITWIAFAIQEGVLFTGDPCSLCETFHWG